MVGFIVSADPLARKGESEEAAYMPTSHIDMKQVQDAREIFGDDSEEILPNPETQPKNVRLDEIYEPRELKSKYVTEGDKLIKATDIPERMQLFETSFCKPSEEVLKEEAEWIWNQHRDVGQKDAVLNVLQTYRNDLLEIPFIYTYRRHVYRDSWERQKLWNIYNLDRQWRYLTEQKVRLREQLSTILEANSKLSFVMEDFKAAQSLPEIEDYRGFIEFYQALTNAEKGQDSAHKSSIKQIYLKKMMHNSIHKFAAQLFLQHWEFSDNFKQDKFVYNLPELKEKVRDLAKTYINDNFKTEDQILLATTKFAAEDLATLPFLRKYMRQFYYLNAVLSTEPTEKGKAELDVFNSSYRVKWIHKRPVHSFHNDIWFDIKHCEARGFITVKIYLENDKVEEVTNVILRYYSPPQNSSTDDGFVQRYLILKETIDMAVQNYLFPYAETQIRESLTERSQEYILDECGKQFRKQIMTGPYNRLHKDPIDRALKAAEHYPSMNEAGIKVLSFVIDAETDRKPTVEMVAVDQYGELTNHKLLYNFIFKNLKTIGPEDEKLYQADKEECKRFIKNYQPDLIIIGANRLEAQFLRDYLRELVDQKEDDDDMNSGKSHEDKMSWVTFGDLTIPKIFSNSEIATKQMPDSTLLMRMAISQARLSQDAMSEILNLWSSVDGTNVIFSLVLHPLQKLVNFKRLEETLEQVAVECVNDVGIDVNRIVEHPHLTNKLAFICGLGPRKAQEIVLSLKKKGKVSSRIQLRTRSISGIGDTVYKNCVGFIKVADDSAEDQYFDIDEKINRDAFGITRIHPESYFLIGEFANNLFSNDPSSKEHTGIRDSSIIIEKILKDPSCLDKLNIEKAKEEFEQQNPANGKLFIDFVISELRHPFKDPRPNFEELSVEDIFYLLMGETRQTFHEGMMVSATITGINSNEGRYGTFVKCKLENGRFATIKQEDLIGDYDTDSDTLARLSENSVIPARIKKILSKNPNGDLKTHVEIYLTIRKQDMTSHKNWLKLSNDDRNYMVIPESDLENKRMIEEEKRRTARYIPRRVTHKKFKNLTYAESIEFLRNKEVGDFVFRPSSRGEDHLTLTFKFYINTYNHVDITETDKLPGMIVGQKLFIGKEAYGSLDEIIARFITPIMQFANETAGYRKFVPAVSIKVIEEHLTNELQKFPDQINYCFTILPEFAQYIILAYIVQKDKIVKEYIRIKPQGYYFHSIIHSSLAGLVQWFKQNFSSQSYQRFVRKYNKPPTIITQQPEQPKPKANEWNEIKADWKNDTGKSLSPGSPVKSKEDKAKTAYLPNTDYDRYNVPAIMKEELHSSYQGKFSTYGENTRQREEHFHSDSHRREEQKHGKKPIICYNCNQEGHISRSCPNQSSRRGSRGGKPDFRGEGRRGMRGRGETRPEVINADNPWGEIVNVSEHDNPKPIILSSDPMRPGDQPYRSFNTYEESHGHRNEPQPMSDTSEFSHRRGHEGSMKSHSYKDERHESRHHESSHHDYYSSSKSGHSSREHHEVHESRGRERGGRRGDNRGQNKDRSREQDAGPKDLWEGVASGTWEDNEGNKVGNSGW